MSETAMCGGETVKYCTVLPIRALEIVSDGVVITDLDGRLTYANTAFVEMTGSSGDRLNEGGGLAGLYSDRNAGERILKVAKTGGNWNGRLEIVMETGRCVPVKVRAEGITDEKGILTGIACSHTCVSEQTLAQEEMLRQRSYMKALHETSLGLISRLDTKELLQAIIAKSVDLVGATDGFLYLYDDDTDDLVITVGTGRYAESLLGVRLKPGQGLAGGVWMRQRPLLVNGYYKWEKRDPNPVYDSLHYALGVPIKSGQGMMGVIGLGSFEPDAVIGHVEMDVMTRFAELASIALDNAKLHTKLQEELRERERAEKDLRRLREMLDSIINSMPSALIGVDVDGNVTQWNREAENETEVLAEQAIGRLLGDVFPRLAGEAESVKKAIEKREPLKKEKISHLKNGKLRFSDITVYPLAGDIQGAVIRIDDVTERVRMEETMIQTEKMLSLGSLAAGMAHEISNPLAGILHNMQVIRNRLTGDLSKNREAAMACNTSMETIGAYIEKRGLPKMLDSVSESGQRAAKIVDNMLSFSRKSASGFIPRNLAQILDNTVDLATNDYDLRKKYDFRNIEIVREYDRTLPDIPCEGSKIQQVFFNILQNSAQALEKQAASSGPPRIVLRLKKDGDMARIEIEDNGPGMPESVRKRIFEPFYTTKEVGEGTGLGLYVSYFIVTKNHRGKMRVESAPEKGTRFVIHVPL